MKWPQFRECLMRFIYIFSRIIHHRYFSCNITIVRTARHNKQLAVVQPTLFQINFHTAIDCTPRYITLPIVSIRATLTYNARHTGTNFYVINPVRVGLVIILIYAIQFESFSGSCRCWLFHSRKNCIFFRAVHSVHPTVHQYYVNKISPRECNHIFMKF